MNPQNNFKIKMTNDIFNNTILCNKCGKKMQKAQVVKNGFLLRVMICPNADCNEKIIHPVDEQEYSKFINLKNKEFHVKMRLVGNSYAVSIPKEIVSFMNAQNSIMDEMVRLCFEDFGRLSLNFEELKEKK
jgi:ABC-type methionine transport system ATPase subunit